MAAYARGLLAIASFSTLYALLRLANHNGADADIEVTAAREKILRHPSQSIEEARLVRDLGEAEYMRRAMREAVGWIRVRPATFLRQTSARWPCGGPRERLPAPVSRLGFRAFRVPASPPTH